jgi:hypothetical protein
MDLADHVVKTSRMSSYMYHEKYTCKASHIYSLGRFPCLALSVDLLAGKISKPALLFRTLIKHSVYQVQVDIQRPCVVVLSRNSAAYKSQSTG